MSDKLHIRIGRKRANFHLDEIIYMEKFGRKICLHTDDETYVFYGKFSEVMERLDGRFKSPHQSYLFNFALISQITDTSVIMDNNTEVRMGKRCIQRARKQYDEYVETVYKNIKK